jgi:hypothetical protein
LGISTSFTRASMRDASSRDATLAQKHECGRRRRARAAPGGRKSHAHGSRAGAARPPGRARVAPTARSARSHRGAAGRVDGARGSESAVSSSSGVFADGRARARTRERATLPVPCAEPARRERGRRRRARAAPLGPREHRSLVGAPRPPSACESAPRRCSLAPRPERNASASGGAERKRRRAGLPRHAHGSPADASARLCGTVPTTTLT